MADSRFFSRSAPLSLADIARISGASLSEDVGAEDFVIEDVAALREAGPAHVSFLDNIKYKDEFAKTKAGACFVHPCHRDAAPKGLRLLLSEKPYKAYALTAQAFYPVAVPSSGISSHAIIESGVSLGEDVCIEAGALVQAGAEIGARSWVQAGAVIGPHVKIGKDCVIGSNAVISHALIGDDVRIYRGACIGQDGFGFAIDPKGHVKVPQLGRVVIEDHVEIGANTTIDRGAGPDTVIGMGTWIDNLVQIGHNVKIGRGCIIVAQSGVSGSTVLEDFVAVGGQVGIAGHLRIGRGARIAAQSGIMRDVPPGEEQMGYPALPIKDFMRQVATLKRLIKKG